MPSDETSNVSPNKAEAEFAKYIQRRDQAAAADASATAAFPSGSLSWAVPVGGAPIYLSGPPGAPARQGGRGERDGGGLADGVGTTLRLGVDLLNVMIFNSVKVLGGFADAYGRGRPEEGGCECECESCCQSHCQPSCCECECCNSSVGSCC